MEGDQFFQELLGRLSALLFLRSPDELRERPKVSAQGERLFELGLKCVEKLRAFDGRIKKLCETDCWLTEGISEEAVGILHLDKDCRSLPQWSHIHQLMREDLSQLHPDRVVRAVERLKDILLQPFRSKSARPDEID